MDARCVLALVLILATSCAGLAGFVPAGAFSEVQRRAQAVAHEASDSLGRMIAIVLGGAAAGAGGGYVAGRRSTRSGGRRWSDPDERPKRG